MVHIQIYGHIPFFFILGRGLFQCPPEKAQFKRTEHKHRSASLDIYEIDALLVDYFETNQYLTRRRFEQLCDFTPSTAARHLKRLLDEGRLKNTNTKQSPVYEPVKGYYGK